MQRRALGILLGMLALGPASTARPDAYRPPPRQTAVEEVTVTARRRAEDIQDTPISITALTEKDLAERGLSRLDDIARYTPNLQFEQAAGSQNSARVQIRGVGTNDPISTRDAGVGVYIDDVYVARAQGLLLPLLDIERVEVLRGPQGTLYGRNTIGGAVKVVTRKPSDELEGAAFVRLGNFDALETQGVLNLPLVPGRVAARVSLATALRDGFSENEQIDQETDDRQLLAGRAQLRVLASEQLELLFAAEQSRAHTAGRGGKCRFRPDAVAARDPNGVVAAASNFLGADDACNASRMLDPHEFLSPVNGHIKNDTWGLTGTATFETSAFTAKSISAWRRQESGGAYDISFSPVPIGQARAKMGQQDQVSQELQLTGLALDSRLVWTSGLYFFYEKTTPSRTDVLVVFDLCRNAPVFCSLSFNSNLGTRVAASAAYGQATYSLSDRLRLTAGLRRSLEAKQFQQFSFKFADAALNPSPNPADTLQIKLTDRFRAWTPHLNASFDLTPNAMLFATYSKGFKSGGFNGRPAANSPETLEPFSQERLHSFELGVKTTWPEHALRANATLFHGDYKDIQQTILSSDIRSGAFAARVENAAEATLRGAEIELEALPYEGLALHAGIGLIDAAYRDLEFSRPVNDPITGAPLDNSEVDFFNTPTFTGTFGASYTLPALERIGSLSLQAFWRHQTRVTFGPTSSTLEQGAYGLLSLRTALALPDGRTELALWVENALDRRYLNDGVNFEDGFASSLAFYGAPRTFGLEIRRRF